MTELDTEEYILISGIQHFAFCPRQWALIHIEGIWSENYFTAQGRLMHEKADDPWFVELRKGKIVSRSMPIRSEKLKMQGIADIVELTENEDGVCVPGRSGKWLLKPVEYKRGRPKSEDCDRLQLCVQALCLEEMLSTTILNGEIYYGEIRRRSEVVFCEELRSEAVRFAMEMHRMISENELPVVKKDKRCRACSLIGSCNPELGAMAHKVDSYIELSLVENDSTIA